MPTVYPQKSPKFWLGNCQPVEKTGSYTDNFSTRACKREAGEVVKRFLEKTMPKQSQVKSGSRGGMFKAKGTASDMQGTADP